MPRTSSNLCAVEALVSFVDRRRKTSSRAEERSWYPRPTDQASERHVRESENANTQMQQDHYHKRRDIAWLRGWRLQEREQSLFARADPKRCRCLGTDHPGTAFRSSTRTYALNRNAPLATAVLRSRTGCTAPQLPGKYEVRAEDLRRVGRFLRVDDGRRGRVHCVSTAGGPQMYRSTDESRTVARERPASLVSWRVGMASFSLGGRCGFVSH